MQTQYKGSSLRAIGAMTLVLLLFCLAIPTAFAQTSETFSDVKVRFVKDKARELEDKEAVLMLDSSARRLRVKSAQRPLDISYDDVQKVVVEVNTFGHKAGFGATFLGLLAGGILFSNAIATSIDKPFDSDHFVLIDYKNPNGASSQYLLNVGKNSVAQVLKSLKASFGDRVMLPRFNEKIEALENKTFTPTKTRIRPDSTDEVTLPLPKGTKTRTTATDKQRPSPELRADKALVVVISPAIFFPPPKAEKSFYGIPIYANDTIVGMVGGGTYTFFYLPPGEYFIASKGPDLVGFRLNLEAGKDYYLAHTVYIKGGLVGKSKSFLMRHSKELVMYEVAGSLWADWGVEVNTR